MDPTQDPNAAAPADDTGADQPVAVIELEIQQDGTIEVSLESGDQEASESGEGGEPEGQTCQSIGEALKVVLQMYKQASGGSGDAEGDAMAQGFSSVRGRPGQ